MNYNDLPSLCCKRMNVNIKKLTVPLIERSEEMQSWLLQFCDDSRPQAVELLLRLQFVSRDAYSEWLKKAIASTVHVESAVYSVRKFADDVECIWDESGKCHLRPAGSLGSEDLVQSTIANIRKDCSVFLLDHPDIDTLRNKRIKKILLLDDSIGSGNRVASFLQRMLKNKSFLSWWSYNRVEFNVISFARMLEAEEVICGRLPGANRKPRKYPATSKIRFLSHLAYRQQGLEQRWGPSAKYLISLCSDQEGIPEKWQWGYEATMANTVFYHSVPNNLPGILWYQSDNWQPLFPNRSFPTWLSSLLEGCAGKWNPDGLDNLNGVDSNCDKLLALVKRGVRREPKMAWDVGLDIHVVNQLMLKMRSLGLVTTNNRITEAGRSFLKTRTADQSAPQFDWSLYIPKTWCAD